MRYTNGLFLIPLLLAACKHADSGSAVAQEPIPVTIAWPASANGDNIAIAGQVEAIRSATISTRVMSTVTGVLVKIGDKVTKGQLLVTVNAKDLDAQKAQTDAQIAAASAVADNARKDLDRYTKLYSQGSATASELDNASLRYHSATANVDAAKEARRQIESSLSYTQLTAPFDGIVTQKLTEPGSLSSPGSPLLVLEQAGTLQVSATVTERDIARIKRGDKAHLSIHAAGIDAEGVVTQVGISSVATGGQYPIKISVPSAAQRQLYSGMYVNVTFLSHSAGTNSSPTPSDSQILVPASALIYNDQLTGLYTLSSSGTAMLQWVHTGKTVGDQVEILSGVARDEPFILHADGRLYNGAPVRKK